MEQEVTFDGFRTVELPNIPILQAELPAPIIDYLWQIINVAQKQPKNLKDGLAGNISKSIELDDQQNLFETFCVPSLKGLDEQFGRGWHPLNSGHTYDYKLTFVYTDVIGNIRSLAIPMEKEFSGNMVIFPSRMKHQVYPFYECEEDRISVAGNFGVIYK